MIRIPHTIRTRGGALMATALAAAAVGCGSSGSHPTTAIRHAISAVSGGLATGNGAETCSSFSPSARQALVKRSKADGEGSTCEQAVETVAKHLSAAQKTALKALTVSHVSVKGNTATVTEHEEGHTSTDTLTKANGHWYLNTDATG